MRWWSGFGWILHLASITVGTHRSGYAAMRVHVRRTSADFRTFVFGESDSGKYAAKLGSLVWQLAHLCGTRQAQHSRHVGSTAIFRPHVCVSLESLSDQRKLQRTAFDSVRGLPRAEGLPNEFIQLPSSSDQYASSAYCPCLLAWRWCRARFVWIWVQLICIMVIEREEESKRATRDSSRVLTWLLRGTVA